MAATAVTTPERVGAIHVHSAFSHDGTDSLRALRDVAVERGIGFVGLTDHAEDLTADGYREYVARCAELSDRRATLIPGLEFRFAGHPGLHLLALGLREWIRPETPEEFVAAAPRRAGLTIVAHPVLARYRIPDAVLAGVDAVEVWNAAYNTRYLPDPRAMALVARLRRTRPELVATAGLDQHDASNDRRTRVVLARATSDPLSELRAGRFVNVGRTLSFDARLGWRAGSIGALHAARWLFDRVERAQERIARSRAAR